MNSDIQAADLARAEHRLTIIQAAIAGMRKARDELRVVGADKAADYVVRALKSAEGALRHAQGRADRMRAPTGDRT